MANSREHILIRIKKAFQGLLNNSGVEDGIIIESTITCPECGHKEKEKMPLDSCVMFYVCLNCKHVMRSKEGGCCVFCEYGDTPCPSKQKENRLKKS